MQNGKVVHFEDDKGFRAMIKKSLKTFSLERHGVVGEAADLAGSIAVLDQIKSGELDANVVLLDGNLSLGVASGEDARTIADYIKQNEVPVRVVGLGGQAMSDAGVEVDIDVAKNGCLEDPRALSKAIDRLEEIEK